MFDAGAYVSEDHRASLRAFASRARGPQPADPPPDNTVSGGGDG